MERIRIEEEEKKKREAEDRRARGLPDPEEEKRKKLQKKQEAEEAGNEKGEEDAANGDEPKVEEPEEPEPEEPEKEDDWKPYIPETPSKICWAVYSSPDTFWLSMDAYDAGYLYECKFISDSEKAKLSLSLMDKLNEPFKSVAVQKADLTHTDDVPLSTMIFELVYIF